MSLRARDRLRDEAQRDMFAQHNDSSEHHHQHLDGTALVCSCGTFGGVICVAFPPEADDEDWGDTLSCEICGKRGVVYCPPNDMVRQADLAQKEETSRMG